MTEKPQWRKSYDAVERAVAPQAEALVRSGQFAHVTAAISGVRRAVGNGVNGVAARVWHLVNLPAGTDLQRLRDRSGRWTAMCGACRCNSNSAKTSHARSDRQ